jgi:hypothetical protein
MIRHLGRILVDLIPKVYDVPRIVRCIKEDGTNYSVPINQPVQVIQQPIQPGQPNVPQYKPVDQNQPPQMPQAQGQMPMQGGPMPPQMQGQTPMGMMPGMAPQMAPMSPEQHQEIAGLIKTFDLAAGKYDVTCESGPSFTTRREESASQMMQFVQAFPQAAPIIGDLIAKSLDWPGSDEIAKRLQAMLPPAAQSGAPSPQLMQAEEAINQLKAQLQQAGQQIQQVQQQLQDKQIENQIKQGELQIKAQEAQAKAQETQVKQYDAETKRMQMMEASKQQPVVETDNTFDAWKLQMQTEFQKWETEYKEQQANMRKQMDIEAAERLELLKQSIGSIVNQEAAEPEEELNPTMDGLVEEPEEVRPDPLTQLAEMHAALIQNLQRPKTIIRDNTGRAVGIQ